MTKRRGRTVEASRQEVRKHLDGRCWSKGFVSVSLGEYIDGFEGLAMEGDERSCQRGVADVVLRLEQVIDWILLAQPLKNSQWTYLAWQMLVESALRPPHLQKPYHVTHQPLVYNSDHLAVH